jgi:hypothetical protein
MAIRETHNGHQITAATWYLLDTAQWKPLVTIIEVKTGSVSTPRINRSFPTEAEAEREAFLFAKKWIDDRKPPLI